jgi:hypothetical protein
MAFEHSRRRIRFYKPPSEEPSTAKEEPKSTNPPSKPLAQRFAEAQPSMPQQHRIVDALSSSSTPVSRTTPETIRTLELNWRERRRAKLEDITLQRAMGVEACTPAPRRRQSVDIERVDEELQDFGNPASEETRRKRISPIAPAKPVAASSDNVPSVALSRHETKSLQPIPVNRMSSASLGKPSIAYTANNTTYQTRANRARKIVKLVRDARLSVQADAVQPDLDVSGSIKREVVNVPEKQLPAAKKPNPTTKALSKSTEPLQAAYLKSVAEESRRPTASAIPTRIRLDTLRDLRFSSILRYAVQRKPCNPSPPIHCHPASILSPRHHP